MRKEIRQEIESRLYNPTGPWISFLSDFTANMNKRYYELYKMRYTQKLSEKSICEALHIERATYYAWIRNIIHDVALAAAYRHLIEVDHGKSEK